MNRLLNSCVKSSILLRQSTFLSSQTNVFLRSTPVCSVLSRNFAAADKKKGKKQQEAPTQEAAKSDSLIPINIYVDGKDPEVLPDDQYPDWLWHMLDPKITPDEWETKNFEGATTDDIKSVIRIKAARRIKVYNLSKAK